MDVTTEAIREVRCRTNTGMLDCKKALLETNGDIEQAIEVLRRQGLAIAQQKATRTVANGVVEAYVHHTGQIGAMVELNCETDFVARTAEFKQLAHDLAMQVAACCPQFVAKEDMPEDTELDPKDSCFLLQPFIKEPDRTVSEIITEIIARVGENIKVRRFSRFELGC